MLRFKQFILQEQILLEARIDFLKTKFKDKINSDHDKHAEFRNSDDIIDHLASKMDPTPNKMYTPWLINQYNKGKFRQEDVPAVNTVLKNFHKYKNNLENKDITSYDLGQLKQTVASHIGTTSTKAEMKKELKDTRHRLIYESPRLNAYHTLGKESNQEFYGGGAENNGTDWCTASRGSDNRHEQYNKDGNLYQIHAKDKDGNEQLFQYQPATGEFKDRHDIDVDMDDFVKQYPEMKDVIAFKGSHPSLPLSHDELTNIIKNGMYTRDTLNYIKDPDHMKLMDDGLMKKIQNGTYDSYDLKHAEDNGYLKRHHLDELPNGLMKKIQNGTYDVKDLEHAVNNNYITPDHIGSLSKAYLQKLKTGHHGLDEYAMNKKLGAVNDAHNRLVNKNSTKILKTTTDRDDVQSIVKSLDDNGLLNDEHKGILKDKLEDHLNDDRWKFLIGKYWKFFRDMAEKHGYMTDDGRTIAKYNKQLETPKKLTQDQINEIANNPKSTMAHGYLATAHIEGKDIGQDAINAIANNPKSTDAHWYLAIAHREGKNIGQDAINAIANNPNSIKAHENLANAYHYMNRDIGQEAINAIANNPKSIYAHENLAKAYYYMNRDIGQEAINAIANNPKSTYAHGVLAMAHRRGRDIGQENYDKIMSYRK